MIMVADEGSWAAQGLEWAPTAPLSPCDLPTPSLDADRVSWLVLGQGSFSVRWFANRRNVAANSAVTNGADVCAPLWQVVHGRQPTARGRARLSIHISGTTLKPWLSWSVLQLAPRH